MAIFFSWQIQADFREGNIGEFETLQATEHIPCGSMVATPDGPAEQFYLRDRPEWGGILPVQKTPIKRKPGRPKTGNAKSSTERVRTLRQTRKANALCICCGQQLPLNLT